MGGSGRGGSRRGGSGRGGSGRGGSGRGGNEARPFFDLSREFPLFPVNGDRVDRSRPTATAGLTA